MKTSVNFSQFCDAFRDMNRNENFSYDGKRALFDFIEEMDDETGSETELDVIALCCESCEDTAENIINTYDIDVSAGLYDYEKEAIVEEYLQNNTMLVGKLDNGSFVYAAF
jgi:hypothetical protein